MLLQKWEHICNVSCFCLFHYFKALMYTNNTLLLWKHTQIPSKTLTHWLTTTSEPLTSHFTFMIARRTCWLADLFFISYHYLFINKQTGYFSSTIHKGSILYFLILCEKKTKKILNMDESLTVQFRTRVWPSWVGLPLVHQSDPYPRENLNLGSHWVEHCRSWITSSTSLFWKWR